MPSNVGCQSGWLQLIGRIISASKSGSLTSGDLTIGVTKRQAQTCPARVVILLLEQD